MIFLKPITLQFIPTAQNPGSQLETCQAERAQRFPEAEEIEQSALSAELQFKQFIQVDLLHTFEPHVC